MFRSCFRMLAVILIFVSQTLKSLSECMHRIPSGMPQCQRLQESLRPHGPQGFSPPIHTSPFPPHPPPPVSASGWQAAAASAPSAAPVAARPGPASPWHPAGAARSPGSSPPPPGSWPPALSGSGNSRSVSQLVSDWILTSCQPHRVTSG